MNKGYCIKCGREVCYYSFSVGVFAHYCMEDGESVRCLGPFTSCPPPEPPEDWELQVDEPGSDELFIMNVHARQLEAEMNS